MRIETGKMLQPLIAPVTWTQSLGARGLLHPAHLQFSTREVPNLRCHLVPKMNLLPWTAEWHNKSQHSMFVFMCCLFKAHNYTSIYLLIHLRKATLYTLLLLIKAYCWLDWSVWDALYLPENKKVHLFGYLIMEWSTIILYFHFTMQSSHSKLFLRWVHNRVVLVAQAHTCHIFSPILQLS